MIFYFERLYHYLYFFFSLCLFLYLFVFIPVSYFLAYSLRACRSRYCIFQLFTWGRWRSANYWLILLHAGFPFFYFFFHDSTCALFLLGFSPIHSLFFLFLFDISFFIFSFLLPCSYRPSIIPCAYFLRLRSSFICIISLQKATLRFRCP